MNRGLLAALVLLTLAAVAGILLVPDADPVPVPIDQGQNPEQGDSGNPLDVAEYNANSSGGRQLSNPTEDPFKPDPTAIIGQILGPSGAPLPYAKVVFAHKQFGGDSIGWTTSAVLQAGEHCDAKGRFRLPVDPGSGNLTLVAACQGYAPQRRSPVAAGEVVDFRLGTLVDVPGRVLDPSGKAAGSIPVELFDPQGQLDGLPIRVRTNQDGQFKLPAPGPGSYALRVKSGSGSEFMQSGIPVSEGMAALEIQLSGNLAMQANLRNSAGLPMPGAKLQLFLNKSPRAIELQSQADGVFRAYGLAAGNWTGIVSLEGYADLNVSFDILGGGGVHEDWTILQNGSVQVMTLSGKGRPLEGTLLRLLADPTGNNRNLKLPEMRSNSDGMAIFAQVPPGRYVIAPEHTPGMSPGALFEVDSADDPNASRRNKPGFAQLIDVFEGQENQITMHLKRHGFLVLKVTRGGQPVVGARGAIRVGRVPRVKALEATDLSDLQGHLTFPATWMGTYEVEIQGSPGELPITRSIEFGRGRNIREVDLPGGILLGRAVAGNEVVVGARVWAARVGEKLRQLSRTDGQGLFEIEGLEGDIYQIRIEADGLTPWQNLSLEHDGQRLDLGDIQLLRSYTLTGRVEGINISKNDLFGPVITIFDGQNRAVASRPLGPEGSFSVPGLAAGGYRLVIYQGGQELLSMALDIPQADTPLVLQVR